jgi:hypothetical protein
MHNTITVGRCSICAGDVTVPQIWSATVPPVPTCNRCFAQAAKPVPILPMVPQPVKPVFDLLTNELSKVYNGF